MRPRSGPRPTDRSRRSALDDEASTQSFVLFLSVITFMGIVLVVISLGGVFDTVLLETRQRTREMAVLKALGMAPRQVDRDGHRVGRSRSPSWPA